MEKNNHYNPRTDMRQGTYHEKVATPPAETKKSDTTEPLPESQTQPSK